MSDEDKTEEQLIQELAGLRQRITGYTREELLARSIADVEATEKPEEIAQHIKRVIEQGYGYFGLACYYQQDWVNTEAM